MLSRWFQRRPDPAPTLTPPVETASAPLAVNLIEAQRSQAVIDLAVAGGDRYQSTIRDIDAEAGLLVIDEVFPAGLTARPGQAVTVTLRWNSRRENFVAHFAGARGVEGENVYLLKLPPTVGYAQRRAAFRLRMPLQRNTSATFYTANHLHYEASVVDVSIGGIRLLAPTAVMLRGGDVLMELQFQLLGQFFHCGAEVRYVNYQPAGTEFGARLVELGMPQQRALGRAIMQLEREQVQRLPRRVAELTAPS